ncbi:MAG: hypothetical protein LBF58_04180 [Deltaproteobacteria bacterium]|jgi:hypothetical protein|nr:hypothetical protein [Deltaproteobacteria bacterium]
MAKTKNAAWFFLPPKKTTKKAGPSPAPGRTASGQEPSGRKDDFRDLQNNPDVLAQLLSIPGMEKEDIVPVSQRLAQLQEEFELKFLHNGHKYSKSDLDKGIDDLNGNIDNFILDFIADKNLKTE